MEEYYPIMLCRVLFGNIQVALGAVSWVSVFIRLDCIGLLDLNGKYYLLLPVCSVYSSVCLWLVVVFLHPFSSGPEVGFYISRTKMTGRDVYQ